MTPTPNKACINLICCPLVPVMSLDTRVCAVVLRGGAIVLSS